MSTKITYALLYSWMYLHALLPLRLLYILSDILYVFAYKVISYRVKVVRENLKNAFPEKTDEERKKIERDFYHHFGDYFVETIKLLHISDAEIRKRMVFKNMELAEDLMKDGNSLLMYLGHYGNWEWIQSIGLWVGNDIQTGDIYRPLRNKAVDDIFLKIRSRFGAVNIPKNNVLRVMVRMRKTSEKLLIGFMSDQNPGWNNVHYWSKFLNQDSAIFTGVERIAKSTGFAVAYLDVTKTGRGMYQAECKLISDNPKEEPEFVITERYIREMEQTILRNPAYWLWTHKRWKYKKEDFVKSE